MQCPICQHNESSVLESRLAEDNAAIRRRRSCIKCEQRFTTYERIKEENLLVIKQDASQEFFNRDKLTSGIVKALDKRPVTPTQIDNVIYNAVTNIKLNYRHTISSSKIGSIVLDELLLLDKVAYVRFSCVHRQFDDINQLLNELKKVL